MIGNVYLNPGRSDFSDYYRKFINQTGLKYSSKEAKELVRKKHLELLQNRNRKEDPELSKLQRELLEEVLEFIRSHPGVQKMIEDKTKKVLKACNSWCNTDDLKLPSESIGVDFKFGMSLFEATPEFTKDSCRQTLTLGLYVDLITKWD